MHKLFLLVFLFGLNAHAGIAIPKFHFVHSETLDFKACTPQDDVKTEWKAEIDQKIQDIHTLWKNYFQWYVGEALLLNNKSYPLLDIQVSLFACGSIREIDVLFQRSLREYLSSTQNAKPIELFLDGVFREFVRNYRDHLKKNNFAATTTPLLTKYRELGESEEVLNEMHILAVQKYVYLYKDQKPLLDLVMQDAKSSDSVRAKAWDLLEKDDFRNWVKEFSQFGK